MKDRFRLMGNFLAADDVPDTLFGFKIVADEKDYTEEDRAFFREHPEAGGYYDLGEDGADEPEDELPPEDQQPKGDNDEDNADTAAGPVLPSGADGDL